MAIGMDVGSMSPDAGIIIALNHFIHTSVCFPTRGKRSKTLMERRRIVVSVYNVVSDWGNTPEKGGSKMVSYRKGIRKYSRYILLGALIAGILTMMSGQALADSGWMEKLRAKDSMIAHEKARAGRMETLDSTIAAFEKAKSAGAEKSAPYEFYTAGEYLLLAKDKLNSGDKVGVAYFAAESEAYSFEALAMTREGAK